jgi:uncharacterized Zn finger protein
MKKSRTDDVSAVCPKCGQEHVYRSVDEMDATPASTPCKKCGFLFLHRARQKMAAMMTLLQSDKKAVSLLKAGDINALNAYIEEKTGIA